MRTIAVVARKGGSGKTTLAVHLAIAAHLRGRKTILADADPQRSAGETLRARAGAGPQRIETASSKLFMLHMTAQRDDVELMVIDTPAGPEHDSHALMLADLTLFVVRPTFLDIAAALGAIEAARRMERPALIVFNQAPFAKARREGPAVQKALEALRFTGVPVAPVILRSREEFQSALASGQSVEEFGPSAAAEEIAALWRHVDEALADRPAEQKREAPAAPVGRAVRVAAAG